MASLLLALPLLAAAQATGGAADGGASYLNSLFECDVRRVANLTTLEPESQSPTVSFRIWYGHIPRSGDEFGDRYGAVAWTVDPSDVLPDEYRFENELPETFWLRGNRGEWLRTLRIAPLEGQGGAFDALIMSVKRGARANSLEAADALHGVCRRSEVSHKQFLENAAR